MGVLLSLLLMTASSVFAADGEFRSSAATPVATEQAASACRRSLQQTSPRKTDVTAISWTTGAYSYDGAGNITSIGPGTGSVTQTYQYDAVGRLATGTANTTAQNNAQTYRYDRYGNLTEIVTTAGAAALATA